MVHSVFVCWWLFLLRAVCLESDSHSGDVDDRIRALLNVHVCVYTSSEELVEAIRYFDHDNNTQCVLFIKFWNNNKNVGNDNDDDDNHNNNNSNQSNDICSRTRRRGWILVRIPRAESDTDDISSAEKCLNSASKFGITLWNRLVSHEWVEGK